MIMNRIKEVLEEKGIKQKWFAERLDNFDLMTWFLVNLK